MADEHDNLVQKDTCKKEHEFIDKTLVDLKANIYTSKESLGNRLDKVDAELKKALLGDSGSPGGLLVDVAEIKKDKQEYQEGVDKDFKVHKDLVAADIRFIKYVAWIAFGLSVLAFGGKFLGLDGNTIKNFFFGEPAPIVTPAPIIEENNSVPTELKTLIQELIKNQEDHRGDHLDIPADKIEVPSSLLDTEVHKDGHKDMPMATVNEIISSTEENK